MQSLSCMMVTISFIFSFKTLAALINQKYMYVCILSYKKKKSEALEKLDKKSSLR